MLLFGEHQMYEVGNYFNIVHYAVAIINVFI